MFAEYITPAVDSVFHFSMKNEFLKKSCKITPIQEKYIYLLNLYVSMHGTIKKSPGPLAPPDFRRPRRNITALSYSWTT